MRLLLIIVFIGKVCGYWDKISPEKLCDEACNVEACVQYRSARSELQCREGMYSWSYGGKCFGCFNCQEPTSDKKIKDRYGVAEPFMDKACKMYFIVQQCCDSDKTHNDPDCMLDDTHCWYDCKNSRQVYGDGGECKEIQFDGCPTNQYTEYGEFGQVEGLKWLPLLLSATPMTWEEMSHTSSQWEIRADGGYESQCKDCLDGEENMLNTYYCTECSSGTYRIGDMPFCSLHSICDLSQTEDQAPSTTRDRTCKCKEGYYREDQATGLTNTQSCSMARKGYYVASAGSTADDPCLEGTYQDKEGQTTCITTSYGEFTAEQGSSQPTLCSAGQYQDQKGQTFCKDCIAGTFQDGLGSVYCKPHAVCADSEGIMNDEDIEPTSTSDNKCMCMPGYFREGSYRGLNGFAEFTFSITEDDGTRLAYSYDLEADSCARGKLGHFVVNNEEMPCPPGRFQNATGQTFCHDCLAGSYAPDLGHVECSNCEPGKFQHLGGQPDCLFCRGYGEPGADDENYAVSYPEIDIPANAVTYFHGEARCYACPPNSVAERVSRHPSDHLYSEKAGEEVYHSWCNCTAGYRANASSLNTALWSSMYADVGQQVNGLQCVPCDRGFYKDTDLNVTSCIHCPSFLGTTANEASASLSSCFCDLNSWGDDRCCSTCKPSSSPKAQLFPYGNVDTKFDDVCQDCPGRGVGEILIDASCKVVSCEPGMQLTPEGKCKKCPLGKFCRDGVAKQCSRNSNDFNRETFFEGASRIGHCRCGSQLKTVEETGDCQFCVQVGDETDWDQNYKYAMSPSNSDISKSARFDLDCLVVCTSGFTGRYCLEECGDEAICQHGELSWPCQQPWSSYCRRCSNVVPTRATQILRYVGTNPPRVEANFERGDTLQHAMLTLQGKWVSSSKVGNGGIVDQNCDDSSDCYIDATEESRTNSGARASQGWVLMSSGQMILPRVEVGLNSIARFYTALADPDQTRVTVQGGNGEEVYVTTLSWAHQFIKFHDMGLTFLQPVYVDEFELFTSLVSVEPGAEEVKLLDVCPFNHACRPGVQKNCPVGSRALPGGNVCLCPPGFRFFALSGSCERCPSSEDCERGYAVGQLRGWKGLGWVKAPQFSCGPLLCCAIKSGVPVCWGDNSFDQLGADPLEQNSATRFYRDARPVANMIAPAVSLSVSQSWGTSVEGAQYLGGWGGSDRSHMSCVLLEDGTVQCWGGWYEDNLFHQCQPPDFSSEESTAGCGFFSTERMAVRVKTGEASACALLDDNSLTCWGRTLWGPVHHFDVKDFGVSDDMLCVVFQSGDTSCFYYEATAKSEMLNQGCTSVSVRNGTVCFVKATSVTCQRRPWYFNIQLTTDELSEDIAEVHVGSGFVCLHMEGGTLLCKRMKDWDVHEAVHPLLSTDDWSVIFESDVKAASVAGGLICALTGEGDLHNQFAGVKCIGDGASALLGDESCRSSWDISVPFEGLRLQDVSASPVWTGVNGASGQHLKEASAIMHRIELVGKAWVQVQIQSSCSKAPCRVALALNPDPLSTLFADSPDGSDYLERVEASLMAEHLFSVTTLQAGESGTSLAHVWAQEDDVLGIILLPSLFKESELTVEKVWVVEDGSSCPYECPENTILRNAQCVPCPETCEPGFWAQGCGKGQLLGDLVCRPCGTGAYEAKPNSNLTLYLNDEQLETEGLDSNVPCQWRCLEGLYWNGSTCLDVRTEPCPVGQYLSPATKDSDATCQPCSGESVEAGRDFIENGRFGEDSCPTQCESGLFLASFGCAGCETRQCGISGERFTDSYQTQTACTPQKDSQCLRCPQNLPEVTLTGNGEEFCDYSCSSGFYKVPQCGQWDEFNFAQAQQTLNELQGVVSGTGDLVFRFTAKLQVSALTNNSFVHIGLRTNVTEGVGGSTFSPLIKVATGVNAWQTVDLRWNVSNTSASSSYELLVDLFESVAAFEGEVLKVQVLADCVEDAYFCRRCDRNLKPNNSSFTVSDFCDFECDEGFELQPDGTCVNCPVFECATGSYQKDCFGCAACQTNESNVVFTSNGERGLPFSCSITCSPGFFSTELFLAGIDSVNCRPCRTNVTCFANQYFRECTDTSDATCASCKVCEPGTKTLSSCNASSDTLCEPCTLVGPSNGLLPENAEWVPVRSDPAVGGLIQPEACAWRCSSDAYILNDLNYTCHLCEQSCAVGFYAVPCSRETEYRGCQPCTFPENAKAVSRGRTTSDSCEWECVEDFLFTTKKNAFGVIQEFTCEAIAPPPPTTTPKPQCTLHSCGYGSLLDLETCSCMACSVELPEHGRYILENSCAWGCQAPFFQLGEECRSVGSISLPPESLKRSIRKNINHTTEYVLLASMAPFIAAVATFSIVLIRNGLGR